MTKMTLTLAALLATVAAAPALAAAPASMDESGFTVAASSDGRFVLARRGADDTAADDRGRRRGGRGADDPAGDDRGRGRGSDDPAGDDRGGDRGSDGRRG